MPTQCFPVRGQSVIDLILEGREKVSVCRQWLQGEMTPPSTAGASEAVNQEMETIPSQAPSDVLSFTLPICVKWTLTGYRVPRTVYT